MKRTTVSLAVLLGLILALSVSAVVSPAPQLRFQARRALLPFRTAAGQNISNTASDSGYPLVGVDAAGKVYVVWLEITSAYQVYFSTNASGSWAASSPAATITYFGADIDGHKGFAVGPGGAAHLVYRDADAQLTNFEVYHALYSGGWGASSDIAGTSGPSSAPACAVNPVDGSLLTVWMDATRTEPVFEVFGSFRQASGTWGAAEPTGVGIGYFPDVAIDSKGRAHLTWSRRDVAGHSSVLYSRNDTPASSSGWTAPIVVKADTFEEWSFPKIDCDDSQNAVIAWIDGNAGNDEIFARRVNSDGTLSEEANVSESAAQSLEGDVAVHRPSGAFSVVWSEGGEILARAYSGAWSAITNVSSSAANSSAPSLAMGTNGTAHVVWQEPSGGNSEIFYAPYGTGITTTTTYTTSSTTTSILVKLHPPLDPTATSVLDPGRATKSVLVAWQKNPADSKLSIANYRIWRKRIDPPEIDFQQIALVPGDSLAYTDGPLSLDQRFSYALTAIPVDPDGLESEPSEIAAEAASFPPLDVALQTATNKSLFRDEKINVLTWVDSPLNAAVRISQFNIYRRPSNDPDASFQKIASVAGTVFEYQDRNLSSEKYSYALTAVDTGGSESALSAVIHE